MNANNTNVNNTYEIDMLIAQLLTKLLNRNQKEQMYLKMIKNNRKED